MICNNIFIDISYFGCKNPILSCFMLFLVVYIAFCFFHSHITLDGLSFFKQFILAIIKCLACTECTDNITCTCVLHVYLAYVCMSNTLYFFEYMYMLWQISVHVYVCRVTF